MRAFGFRRFRLQGSVQEFGAVLCHNFAIGARLDTLRFSRDVRAAWRIGEWELWVQFLSLLCFGAGGVEFIHGQLSKLWSLIGYHKS